MKTIEQLNQEIAACEKYIESIREYMDNFEIDSDDYEDQYDEMLDDVHGEFMGYLASRILREVDPIAYFCGLSDYVDSIDKEEIEEYQEMAEELEELKNALAYLENELEELEKEENKS